MKQISVIFWVIVGSLFMPPCNTYNAKACGGGVDEEMSATGFNSFFAPEIIGNSQFSPFFASTHYLYPGPYYEQVNLIDSLNISEWVEFFSGKLSREEVDLLVYQIPSSTIDSFITYQKNREMMLSTQFTGLELWRIKDKKLVSDFLHYLDYARRTEELLSSNNYYWNDDTAKLSFAARRALLLVECNQELKAGPKNKTLKLRYSFQMIRLLRHSGYFSMGISYYENVYKKLADNSLLFNRIRSYYAGCLYKNAEYAKANLEFARVYDHGDALKIPAYQGFHPMEDFDWEQALKLAATPREKTVLWHLFGIYNDPILAITEISKTDPNSDLIPLLITRIVNIQEAKANLPCEDCIDIIPFPGLSKLKDEEIQKFLNDKANIYSKHQVIYELSAAYLNYLMKDYNEATLLLQRIKQENLSALQRQQLHVQEFLIYFTGIKYINSKEEQELVKGLKMIDAADEAIRKRNITNYVWLDLAKKYKQQNNLLKAELCLSNNSFLNPYDNRSLNQILDFITQKESSEFDQYLAQHYQYSVEQVYEQMGVNYMSRGEFEKAFAIFLRGNGRNLQLRGDPFSSRIRDCHDCDHEVVLDKPYTRLSYVEHMLELKNRISEYPKPEDYFELGNGFYNMSYYGNARVLSNTAYTYVGVDAYLMKEYSDTFVTLAEPFYSNDLAFENYRLALILSRDKEFQAKCAFMCAKCEQNNFFESEEYFKLNSGKEYKDRTDFKAGKYFKLLKENYAQTNYYKEILNECGHFRTYINKSGK